MCWYPKTCNADSTVLDEVIGDIWLWPFGVSWTMSTTDLVFPNHPTTTTTTI